MITDVSGAELGETRPDGAADEKSRHEAADRATPLSGQSGCHHLDSGEGEQRIPGLGTIAAPGKKAAQEPLTRSEGIGEEETDGSDENACADWKHPSREAAREAKCACRSKNPDEGDAEEDGDDGERRIEQ
jgi:hypothetical protein